MEQLSKKYGVVMATAMVIGTVIGSGIFFKAEKILQAVNGNILKGAAAWLIGGAIMLACARGFSLLAGKYSFVNGIVDYGEAMAGAWYGNILGWFMTTVYYPALVATLSWVSGRYFCILFGMETQETLSTTAAFSFLILSFFINTLAPYIAGKIQVSATVIKLIPLVLMGIAGTVFGVKSGFSANEIQQVHGGIFAAVTGAAFAYEGWIVATTINAELKNAKKDLPLALTFGAIIVIAIYILYYIGISGAAAGGEAKTAFYNVFGSVGGTGLFVFVVVSCLGTLNGLMLGLSRGLYSLAVRKEGPRPKIFSSVDKTVNMPVNSAIGGLLISLIWLILLYGMEAEKPWFGIYRFDITETPIIACYALYIPIFIMIMIKEKDFGIFNRFVIPLCAVAGCIFMVIAACIAHGKELFWFAVTLVVIMIIGWLTKGKNFKNVIQK